MWYFIKTSYTIANNAKMYVLKISLYILSSKFLKFIELERQFIVRFENVNHKVKVDIQLRIKHLCTFIMERNEM